MDRGHRLSRGAGWVGWILIAAVPLAFLAVFFAWPAAALILRGFHDGESWSIDGLCTDSFAGSRGTESTGSGMPSLAATAETSARRLRDSR